MLPLFVQACPTFARIWEEHKCEYAAEKDYLPYIAISELVNHLIDQYESGKTGEFDSVCEVIERLHIEGEHYVKEAATIGFLESLQNQLMSRSLDSTVFFDRLGPVSHKWWEQLNLFWDGKIKYVGETLS